jgi:hypothetical protein
MGAAAVGVGVGGSTVGEGTSVGRYTGVGGMGWNGVGVAVALSGAKTYVDWASDNPEARAKGDPLLLGRLHPTRKTKNSTGITRRRKKEEVIMGKVCPAVQVRPSLGWKMEEALRVEG